MKRHIIGSAIIFGILFTNCGAAYASWGWESTDDPEPYYHQEWGKWYKYDDVKMFMVQMDDKTYKYVFDYKEKLIGGWMTYMPMKLN